jgi:hypothetical protein
MPFLHELDNTTVYFDNLWKTSVRDRFCRKMESVEKKDNLYFSQYWQGYAWAAIIGFRNNRSLPLDPKTKETSFKFGTIMRQGSSIADALILMAIAKSDKGEEILENPSELVEIISRYASGGAQIINEIRETPGKENMFNYPDEFLSEIEDR